MVVSNAGVTHSTLKWTDPTKMNTAQAGTGVQDNQHSAASNHRAKRHNGIKKIAQFRSQNNQPCSE